MSAGRVLELARELVRRPSVTPEDAGCQALMAERLERIGFQVERQRYGEVDNFWARRGHAGPLLCFAGHTDVVPTGPLDAWTHPPFEAEVKDGLLWGRGAADMKASLAAMIVACEEFLAARPDHRGSLAFLVTSDEEGPAQDGTKKVIEALEARGEKIDWCLVGEPSSRERLGDMLRIGRRGSLSCDLLVHGIQGHVAYPEKARNPLHQLAPFLQELVGIEWDAGNASFPPTSLQLTNLHSGTGFRNVIPGSAELKFNLRYSTEQTMAGLQERIEALLQRHGLDYEVSWRDAGRPFLTRPGPFLSAVQEVVRDIAGVDPELSTGGGTSDGRFIAPTGAAVVELGPVNASIHKIDEHVRVDDLEPLKDLYLGVMRRLLA
ncbi:succinyl-diaminopimelate desuccinylase [Thioalkalivibrio sp. XN8]|uniref:succinyl-diaminopimelate desuccinylase n=1 Tax=Thioalkalivibrio sp. XN8 TaxID=2712863 RepID=UPI0013EAEFAB|nr:succinyl-diaminopimelate desuccinylase [Thioalkalivibrio sp. XN8]NGP53637.1 succinyl-diaminopimelate desuccinylase [Thioalkalivibrio sp. XN8]